MAISARKNLVNSAELMVAVSKLPSANAFFTSGADRARFMVALILSVNAGGSPGGPDTPNHEDPVSFG